MDLTCSLPLQKLTRCERSKSWVPQNWLSPPLTLEGLEIPYPIPEQHLTLPTRCSDTDSVTTSQQPASLSLKGKTSSLKTRFEIAEAWCRLLTRFWPEGRLHSEQHPCWGCVYATTEVRTFSSPAPWPSTLWLSTLSWRSDWLRQKKTIMMISIQKKFLFSKDFKKSDTSFTGIENHDHQWVSQPLMWPWSRTPYEIWDPLEFVDIKGETTLTFPPERFFDRHGDLELEW